MEKMRYENNGIDDPQRVGTLAIIQGDKMQQEVLLLVGSILYSA
jgi:hypothetical protein